MPVRPKKKKPVAPGMVDVGKKSPTERTATAAGWIRLNNQALAAVLTGELPKGDVIATATLAGIQAAKRTAEMLPLCHPLGEISVIEVSLTPQESDKSIEIHAIVKAHARTGVEMEALCAISAAALCVYDMCKALDPAMEIGGIRLLEKKGGQNGPWKSLSQK